MKVTVEQFKLVKRLLSGGFSQVEASNISGVSKSYVWLLNKADSYDDFKNLYRNTFNQKKTPELDQPKQPEKPSAEISVAPTSVLIALRNLTAAVDVNSKKVDEMLEAYKWVVEHAQVDYKKKWFR